MTNTARITSAPGVGTTFEGRPRIVSWERLWAFSGGPFAAEGWPRKNIHTDLAAANAAGVSRVAASGTQYQGYLTGLLIDLFGEGWLATGTLAFRLPAVGGVHDTITPKVCVTSVEEGAEGCRVGLDVWCENQEGARVLAGTATGLIDCTAPT
ncbi:MAG: MaoC family dehydratase [Microbacteriaceae bacterium]|nr:MaoC family dehydratase [Microbacteriaceae bacterium]